MTLGPAARERALRAALEPPLWIGLAIEQIEDGSLVELSDPSYERRPVSFGEPVSDAERTECRNVMPVQFPPLMNDAEVPIRYFFIIRAYQGDGELVAAREMTSSDLAGDGTPMFQTPRAGVSIWFGVGDVKIAQA